VCSSGCHITYRERKRTVKTQKWERFPTILLAEVFWESFRNLTGREGKERIFQIVFSTKLGDGEAQSEFGRRKLSCQVRRGTEVVTMRCNSQDGTRS